MTNEELAAMWNQHDYCPECKRTNILNVSKTVKVSLPGVLHTHDVPEYMCVDCGCKWWPNEPSYHFDRNIWTGKNSSEIR